MHQIAFSFSLIEEKVIVEGLMGYIFRGHVNDKQDMDINTTLKTLNTTFKMINTANNKVGTNMDDKWCDD